MKSTLYHHYYEMLSEYGKKHIEEYLIYSKTHNRFPGRSIEDAIHYLEEDIVDIKNIEDTLNRERFKEPMSHPFYWQTLALVASNLLIVKSDTTSW